MITWPVCAQPQEVLQLELERLVVGDLRAVDVAGAGAPLAVGVGGLPRRLVVDRHLALELHVVEHDHLLVADDGHLAHLVRVEPGEVHVGDATRGKAEEAEDDVFDPRLDEVLAVRHDLARLLAEQPEDHREIVHAERPERVLVRPDLPQVLAVPVHAGDVAELPRVDELLHLAQSGVVEQQVPRHQHEVVALGDLDQLRHLLATHRRGLLHEDVLARLERSLRERVVRRHRRGDHDRVDGRIRKRLVELGRHAGSRVPLPEGGLPVPVGVDDPAEVGDLADDPHHVLAPPADPDVGDPRHSFQTLSLTTPARPVALRRSTTSAASSTSCA